MTTASTPLPTRRRLLVLAAVVLAFATGARAADLPDRFEPTRDAAADIAQVLATAAATGRRVLVDVGGEWCTWCHIMDAFFASDAEARALRERSFVWVKVNWSPQNRNEAVLSRWPKVKGYPHLFVLAADGTLLHSQDTGELEAKRGYDRAAFIAFLKRWAG